jgi:hypothetical protein
MTRRCPWCRCILGPESFAAPDAAHCSWCEEGIMGPDITFQRQSWMRLHPDAATRSIYAGWRMYLEVNGGIGSETEAVQDVPGLVDGGLFPGRQEQAGREATPVQCLHIGQAGGVAGGGAATKAGEAGGASPNRGRGRKGDRGIPRRGAGEELAR